MLVITRTNEKNVKCIHFIRIDTMIWYNFISFFKINIPIIMHYILKFGSNSIAMYSPASRNTYTDIPSIYVN